MLAFHAKEAERKMRDAVTRLDFEAAIPLRDEMRRLQAELLEAERQAALVITERKVIDFKSRTPVTPEPDRSGYTVIDLVTEDAVVEPEVVEPFEPFIGDVKLLEDMGRLVADGSIQGLMIFAGIRKQDGAELEIEGVDGWTTALVDEDLDQYLGAMERTKHDLLMLADETSQDEEHDVEQD